MANINLKKQFAERLRQAMISSGFTSARSIYGVDVKKLAEITNYSIQICRKYLRGEAMPEFSKLMEIADELKVSPGWLAFGDSLNKLTEFKEHVLISKEALSYVFMKALSLQNYQWTQTGVSNFLIELINSLSIINGSEEQSTKIIDLAFSSGMYFQAESRKCLE